MGARLAAITSWLDDRTGLPGFLRRVASAPIPGGASWAYVFGAALAALLFLELVTGVLLTLYYVPSAEHANATVAYVQKAVPLGWLVRGVHAYGATAVIVVVLLHLAQTLVAGAYKERREAVWLSGVVLLVLVLGLGYTGYQLPWDQRAYYSTQVAVGIARSVPLVGEAQAALLLGGDTIGQATLSRYFFLHVALLPALLAMLVLAHVLLFRHRGFAGRAGAASSRAYYPGQFVRDTAGFVVLSVLLVALSYAWPVVVGPPIDPSASYVAMPEWFFLWLNLLMKFVPAFAGGVLVPGAIIALLALLPFLDRSPTRAVRSRSAIVAGFGLVGLAIVGMTAYAIYRDATDPVIVAQEAKARAALAEPFEPVVTGADTSAGPDEAPASDAGRAAPPAAFLDNCARCHGRAGQGRAKVGPSLVGVTAKPRRSPAEIARLVRDPRAFGLDDRMPAFENLPEEDVAAIVEWVATLK